MIRVILPAQLRALAGIDGEDVIVAVEPPATTAAVLDALEASYPVLRSAIRDRATKKRRPFLRYFACEEDISLQAAHIPLPDDVQAGRAPLILVAAIAGG